VSMAGRGVEIVGTGSALPARRLTNTDLEKVMDTSDEWIVQRTGIRERRVRDPEAGPTTTDLGEEALTKALADAGVAASALDLILVATMTPDMPTPGVAPVLAARLGCGNVGAMDVNAACSGFVFTLNLAQELVRGGRYSCVGIVGADTITRHIDYSTFGRGAAILFGDAGAAMVIRAGDDPGKGLIAEAMHSDGDGARHLYVPCTMRDFPAGDEPDERKLTKVQMAGQPVFKFAVGKFPAVIEETLEKAGVRAADVDHYVCHQANARILEAARTRFGLDAERLTVNIDRYGNTVGASCPLVFDELRRAGRIHAGQKVMFLAFGAGLTWGSSLWQV